MAEQRRENRGFTLIEVSFATGIIFLTFILILGGLAHLALLREVGERRHLAAICLNHCLEQLQARPGEATLTPPPALPGTYEITVEPAESGLARITVITFTTRGHPVQASGIFATSEVAHAP